MTVNCRIVFVMAAKDQIKKPKTNQTKPTIRKKPKDTSNAGNSRVFSRKVLRESQAIASR